MADPSASQLTILVTGATGYVGGRLIPVLLERGHRVRCMTRSASRLAGRAWSDQVEVVEGNALAPETLADVLAGVDVAYYLIHSLSAGKDDFAERDRTAARNFGAAAEAAGVDRIIYLGGLKPSGDEATSLHLESRLETGDVLRESSVPVTEFRAGVIIGSGSLSFELIRYLTERVPLMITPRWVTTRAQPIAIRNVLAYLADALTTPESTGRIIDIGGRDVLTYAQMFRIYAQVRGLKRAIIKVPVLTPKLSSYWIGFVTPLSAPMGRILIEGLKNEVVCRDDTALQLFSVALLDTEEAMRIAVDRARADQVLTNWAGAFSSSATTDDVDVLGDQEGMLIEHRERRVAVPASFAFGVVKGIGGDNGWLYANKLWALRGLLDILVGGVGLRRGRRSPTELFVGETVDFWRVEAIEENRLLRLRAEMKVPGRAWLQFETKPDGPDACQIIQTALFEPRGLFGVSYWYALYPVHKIIFTGMIEELRRRAEAAAQAALTAKPA